MVEQTARVRSAEAQRLRFALSQKPCASGQWACGPALPGVPTRARPPAYTQYTPCANPRRGARLTGGVRESEGRPVQAGPGPPRAILARMVHRAPSWLTHLSLS